jgi:hypothetical protein
MLLAKVGAPMAIAAMLIPAAAGVAAPAKSSGPTIKFAKNTKVYSSHKATMWLKCMGKKGEKNNCKGTLKMKMRNLQTGKMQVVSKQHFSIKPNRKVVIHLHLTKAGHQQLKYLIAHGNGWKGKCPVKAKAKQGNSHSKTSTGEVGYRVKG